MYIYTHIHILHTYIHIHTFTYTYVYRRIYIGLNPKRRIKSSGVESLQFIKCSLSGTFSKTWQRLISTLFSSKKPGLSFPPRGFPPLSTWLPLHLPCFPSPWNRNSKTFDFYSIQPIQQTPDGTNHGSQLDLYEIIPYPAAGVYCRSTVWFSSNYLSLRFFFERIPKPSLLQA